MGKADAVGGPSSHVVREGEEKEPGSMAVGSDHGPEGPWGRRAGAQTAPERDGDGGSPGGPWEAETPAPARLGSHIQQKTEMGRRKGGGPGSP